ncbi:MAG: fatty acyl-AMP ligase [Chloroflexaceae bacterium]|nr:fatty acyl-AMP ligase [Chloroflexaceae bacterium]
MLVFCHELVFEPEFATFVDLLRDRALQTPDRIAYRFLEDGETESARLTYQGLDQRARAIAAKLQRVLEVGERVLMLYPPGLEFVSAFFGCLYAGAIAIPATLPRRHETLSRLQVIINSARPTVLLTALSFGSAIEGRCGEVPGLNALKWIATDDFGDELAVPWQKPPLQRNTLAFLQYTSGSTGNPKGVMVTHGNLIHNSAAICQSFADTAESIGVTWLPPHHDMGLIGGLLQPLYVGASTVLMSPLFFMQKPLRWLQAISRYRATTSGGPNFAYDLCVSKITEASRQGLDLSCWQVAFVGAEPIRAATLARFADAFAPYGFRREAFHPCYGLAENTLLVSGGEKLAPLVFFSVDRTTLAQNRILSFPAEPTGQQTLVSSGQSLLNQVAIANPQTLAPCDGGEVGEIWVKGDSVAQGYWQRPDATQQTFQAYLSTGEGPFLRTGDLGFLHKGELYVTGRLKDLIIIRGQNYYPQDIELTVENSHPALRHHGSAAFTVEDDEQERLIVVAEVERSYRRKLDRNHLVKQINQAVAAQYALQIHAIALIKTGSLPRTSSGKVQRLATRSSFLTGNLEILED